MGPLFSALVLGLSTLGAFALAYAVARFFQPASAAVRMAAVFILGSAVGGNAIALALSIFVRSTLTESRQVIAYLLSLGLGAFASGAALLVFCIKRRVLTLRSSGPPQAASA